MAHEKIKNLMISAQNGSTEMDKVLFYNSNLTETDQNIL